MEKGVRLGWGRVILTSLGAYLIGLLLTTIVVTGYAFKLAFQARGAPDQARISQFAQHFSGSWGMAIGLLVTFGAAIWVARKVRAAAAMHGVAVGITVAVLGLVVGSLFSGGLTFRTLIDFAATTAAGWMGGLVGGRAKTKVAAEARTEAGRV